MLIYDVGMFDGNDTAYYLAKGARVVGIEANPVLAAAAATRFAGPLAAGRLVILGIAVGAEDGEADFFICHDPVRSSLHRVKGTTVTVRVALRRLSSVIAEHGMPDFAKIDVEHVDEAVLRDLREADCLPGHLSTEAHGLGVLDELQRCGFTRFRLVNGREVHRRFGSHQIAGPEGRLDFRFNHHSSGPFGEDLPDPWVDGAAIRALWPEREAVLGQGWFDLHAIGRDAAALADGASG